MDESRRRLIRVTPIVVCHHVESVEHIFFSCPLAQQVCPMQLTSFGNSLLKEVTLALRIYFFQWCSASLMNFLANDWNHSLVFGSSWKVFFYGLFDFLKNDMTCSALQWLVVKHTKLCKIPYLTMVDLSNNKLSWFGKDTKCCLCTCSLKIW